MDTIAPVGGSAALLMSSSSCEPLQNLPCANLAWVPWVRRGGPYGPASTLHPASSVSGRGPPCLHTLITVLGKPQARPDMMSCRGIEGLLRDCPAGLTGRQLWGSFCQLLPTWPSCTTTTPRGSTSGPRPSRPWIWPGMMMGASSASSGMLPCGR